jgi:F-box/leucine-rich repeat protein 14
MCRKRACGQSGVFEEPNPSDCGFLCRLPRHVFVDGVLSFLDMADFSKFDVALCNQEDRAYCDSCFKDIVVAGTTEVFCDRQVKWMTKKNLRAQSLVIQNSITKTSLKSLFKLCGPTTGISLRGYDGMNDSLMKILLSNCKNLESMNLAYCSDLTDDSLVELARANPSLNRLVLWGCYNTTNTTLEALAASCKSMKSLNLKCCKKISDAGLMMLTTMTELEEVNLTYCRNITDLGLLKFLRALPKLRSLCLAYCSSITDMSLLGIARCCPFIETLDVTQCNISDGGLQQLAKMPETMKLRDLNLTSCQNVTSVGLSFLLRLTPQLKSVNVEDCTSLRVDEVPVQELIRRGVVVHRF